MAPKEIVEDPLIRRAWEVAQQGEAKGMFRFSMIEGRRFYERPFTLQHQGTVTRILGSTCCPDPGVALNSVHIAFDEWSLLCPDIAVWDHMPDEQDTPVTLHPRAVVEVLDAQSRSKDTDYSLPFYLRTGVSDILLVDPETQQTHHYRPGQTPSVYHSSHSLMLACGCQITV